VEWDAVLLKHVSQTRFLKYQQGVHAVPRSFTYKYSRGSEPQEDLRRRPDNKRVRVDVRMAAEGFDQVRLK
jgi:hypothetical protein